MKITKTIKYEKGEPRKEQVVMGKDIRGVFFSDYSVQIFLKNGKCIFMRREQ